MRQRATTRRRHSQARRVRRFEAERPTLRAIVSEGSAWTALNRQRLPGLVLVLSSVLALTFLFTDPRFFVYRAQVTGPQLLAAEQIYQASGADMMSVFFVAPRAVQERLLAQLPGLQQVRVAVNLPGELHIHVVERKVRFVWEAAGRSYLADERGNVLASGGVSAPPDALRIRAEDGAPVAEGQTLDPAVLDAVAQLSQLLGGQRTFEYSARYGVGWRTEGGWPVHFGVGGDMAEKVAVMRTIMTQLERARTRPQLLDVSVPSRPYYR